MNEAASARKGLRPRKILGISLPASLAAEVKAEAAQRQISLKALFMEMWALYRSNNRKQS